MALCDSTSESVHASVWRSGRKEKKTKNNTSANEIKEALIAALKTPTCRWGELTPPPSSSFLCWHGDGSLKKKKKKKRAELNNCKSIIRVIQMFGNLLLLLSARSECNGPLGMHYFLSMLLLQDDSKWRPCWAAGARRIKESQLFLRHECDTTAAAVHQRLGKVSIDPLSIFLCEQSFIATTQRSQEHKS